MMKKQGLKKVVANTMEKLTPIGIEETNDVTGTLVSYYFVCHRKLWLHAKGLDLENAIENVNVTKGKILHNTRYSREKKRDIQIDNIKIDFLKYGDKIVVHEIKKSKKLEEAHIWQLKYYLYLLRQKNVNCDTGIINYPSSMKKIEVKITEEDEATLKRIIPEIKKIINSPVIPKMQRKSFCKKCAYWDFCAV